jgi:hypothetical protein
MSFSYFVDRMYWAVLILGPLGYAVLNFDTFRRKGRRYMLYLLLLDLSVFASSSISFLLSHSAAIQGNIHDIRLALSAIAIVRYPLDLFFCSRLVRDVLAKQVSI